MSLHTGTSSFVDAQTSRPPGTNWRLLILLWGLSILGLVAAMPYSLMLQKDVLSAGKLPLPVPEMIALELVIQSLILFLVIYSGLRMAATLGLGAPVLSDWLAGKPWKQENTLELVLTILIGLAVSAMVAFLDAMIFLPLMKSVGDSLPPIATPSMWEGLLSSIYGGFTEEILMRLFLMSLFGWVATRIARRKVSKGTKPRSPAVMWGRTWGRPLSLGSFTSRARLPSGYH